MSASDNAILSALPLKDSSAPRERLKQVTLEQGQLLGEAGAPIAQVIFPTAGLISVVAELASGERIETALIGHSGTFGAAAVFGAKTHVGMSFVQMAGAGLAMRAPDFVELAQGHENLRLLLFRQEQYLLAQAQQSVACNARHQIPERLATWLLRARDAAGQTHLQLTQEFLAQMLGVQRASVSLVAGKLQDDGLIRYRRGRIDILDEKRLGQAACECCHAVRMQYRRIFERG